MNYPPIEKPTKPGNYFFKGGARPKSWRRMTVICDADGLLALPMSSICFRVGLVRGEWRGPVPEPSE